VPKPFQLLLVEARQRSHALSRRVLTGLGLGLVLFLEVLGYFLGSPILFSFLYLIPISLVTWRVGLIQGVVIALISALPFLVSDSLSAAAYSHSIAAYWNSAVRVEFFFIFILVLSISKMKKTRRQEKLAESILALQETVERNQRIAAIRKNAEVKSEELMRNAVPDVSESNL
jgi:hypothetical protein